MSDPDNEYQLRKEQEADAEFRARNDTLALEARLREIASAGCSHDMGFDRELGPMGCDLELDGKGGCFCAGFVPGLREAADAIATLWRERDEAQAAMKWTDEVYPSRLKGGGAGVEITWDEFNRMREAAGFKPVKRISGDEGRSGLNARLRARTEAAEAEAVTLRKENAALKAQVAEGDKHAEKIEALLEPNISWEGQPSKYDAAIALLAETSKVLERAKGRTVGEMRVEIITLATKIAEQANAR